ncbi:MAG: hypothetical protein AAF265_07095 [Pseudomonadota bacterium]
MKHLCATLCLLLIGLVASSPVYSDGDAGEPVVVRDPYYGDVLFHFYKGDYFNAIVRLTAAQKRGVLTHHDEDAELLRGGLALSYGLHDEAGRIFDALLATKTRPEIRDRTWFFLAKIRYQRGYLDAAADALAAIGDELPENLEPERHVLAANVAIARGQFDQAITALERWKGPKGWSDYARFNLGVALVRAGRFAEGANWLDKVGRLGDDRPEMLGLRDKANVALGYTWLQNDAPERARPVLQRVRLKGPFSNKALLGVGWADSDSGNFRSALTPWNELAGRDLLDPAVQESLLAVPYALGKLDATGQAATQYENAIVAFSQEHQRLTNAIADIEAGGMLDRLLAVEATADDTSGWYWRLEEMPDATESRYLYLLMAEHGFQEALKSYRDLVELRANLLGWRDRTRVFREIMDTRKAGYAARLPRIEASLASADMQALRNRHDRLAARLQRVEAEQNLFALATRREQQLADEIRQVAANPVLKRSSPEIDDVNSRIRLLQGVLQWQAEQDFPARVWRQKKQLHDVNRILVGAERARLAVDDARVNEPARLLDFDDRVGNLTPRIDTMLARVEATIERQRAFLDGLAVDELRAQQERLDTYTVQARFALAAVYDRATAASNGDGVEP